MAARLQEFYRKEVVPALMKQLGRHEPDGRAADHEDHAEHGRRRGAGRQEGARERDGRPREDHAARSPCRAMRKKSVASFKVRDGVPIGCKVTLRNARMYEFLDRLISVAMPRIRDFRGLSRARSTAAAITTWASKSRSFFRKSTTTRSTRSAVSTSRSRRLRATDDAGRALLEAFKFPLRGDR